MVLRPPNRSVSLLVVCVAFAATGMFSAITVGAIEAVNLAGSRAAAGVPGALAIVGAASGSFLLGMLMQARGRRIGLGAGWTVAAAGGLVGAVGVQLGSFTLVLVGMWAIGLGNGGSQLARYAAAETVAQNLRARALSWVVWANAIGAVAGPLSLGAVGRLAARHGLQAGAGGFLMVTCAGTIAALLSTRYRPPAVPALDELGAGEVQAQVPLAAAGTPPPAAEAAPTAVRTAPPPAGSRPSESSALWTAVVCLIIAQAAMVMVMSITPVHLSGGGHAYGVVGMVMGGHFVGMFALAPLAGWLVDRVHPYASIRVGLAVLAGGAALAGLLPVSHGAVLSLPLMLIGIGWCVCFVGASTAVTAATRTGAGAALQGRLDSLVWAFSAVSSLSAGVLLWMMSYGSVTSIAIALVAIAALITLLPQRTAQAAPSCSTR